MLRQLGHAPKERFPAVWRSGMRATNRARHFTHVTSPYPTSCSQRGQRSKRLPEMVVFSSRLETRTGKTMSQSAHRYEISINRREGEGRRSDPILFPITKAAKMRHELPNYLEKKAAIARISLN